MRTLSLAGAALAALLLSACTIQELKLDAKAPEKAPPLPPELAARFAYEPSSPTVTVQRVEDTDDYEKTSGEYAVPSGVSGTAKKVVFEMWRTKHGEGRRPLVVLVPILAGRYPECDHLGRLLSSNGMHAFFVHREDNLLAFAGAGSDEPFEQKLRRSIVNIRRTLDWALARPDVDPTRVGMVGISMGAIAGSILLAVEPRIGAGVLIMGGGDLPEVMARSIETPVLKWRVHKLKEMDGDIERVKALVRTLLPSDPLDFAPYVGARRVQQYIALYDNKVPTANQWKLWNALGHPEGFAIPIGHYTSIFYLGFAEEKSLAFMRKTLRIDAPGDTEKRTKGPLDAVARSR